MLRMRRGGGEEVRAEIDEDIRTSDSHIKENKVVFIS